MSQKREKNLSPYADLAREGRSATSVGPVGRTLRVLEALTKMRWGSYPPQASLALEHCPHVGCRRSHWEKDCQYRYRAMHCTRTVLVVVGCVSSEGQQKEYN
jgi:hypothetical protein